MVTDFVRKEVTPLPTFRDNTFTEKVLDYGVALLFQKSPKNFFRKSFFLVEKVTDRKGTPPLCGKNPIRISGNP